MSAPAKINLYLDILRKRSDGYHEIETVMQTVDLCDKVTVSVDTDEKSDRISISCTNPEIPTDENNICFKAARNFFEYCGGEIFRTDISIEKIIPSKAGLGGGSADAAAVIAALNNLLGVWLDSEELINIAAKTGADVPYCLIGKTQYCTGIGDNMRQLRALPGCRFVIAKGNESVSTGEAYLKADGISPFCGEDIAEKFCAENITDIAPYCKNLFEEALDLPEAQKIKEIMTESDALCSCMTGSGSAVFGIFKRLSAASDCAERLKAAEYTAFSVSPLNCGVSVI